MNRGGNESKPQLWFRKSVPYEHVVVPYAQLHPILKDCVDEIGETIRKR
ncbi:hypothetical protein HY991_01270 [Candidatus Micrarchaeota archaeon]|nr:hypothetical protein [Candidatus Micrarchaeota archaeon]